MVFRQIPTALAVNAINSTLTFIVLSSFTAGLLPLYWLVLVTLVTVFRGVTWRQYNRATDKANESRRWANLAMAGSGLSGLLWGIGGVVLFPDAIELQMFLTFVLAGMCAGAVGVSAAHLPTLCAFLLAAGLPIAARFLIEGSTLDTVMGLMIVVFIGALSQIGRSLNQTLIEAMRLRFELSERTQALDEAYRSLKEETAERLSAEAELHQSQKLNALGQFTAGIAHDFNNLLTVVSGNLDILRTEVETEKGRRLLAAAQDGAERGARLVASLLAFGRRQLLRPQTLDANKLIQELDGLLRKAAGHAVEMRFLLNPSPVLCHADPVQLQAALVNLTINARDAVAEMGGYIAIKTENRVVDADFDGQIRAGSYAVLSVIDNGAGMSPEVQKRAFEPFFTTKPAGKGNGLGLSQVFGFVNQSGGYLHLISELGAGTTFHLYLPQSPGMPAATPQS